MTASTFCRKQPALSRAVAAWFAEPPGLRLAENEREIVSGMVGDLFGYHLLQVGDLGADLAHLDGCPVTRKLHISGFTGGAASTALVSDAGQLPVTSDSVDVVVLPHTLDFTADPHEVLREVERVLIAEGRVIVIGFNPFSLWGVWRLFGRWRGNIPWCGHFLSYPRLNDWLTLLGFDIERMDVMAFRPPLRNAGSLTMERIGRRLWPMAAGVYVVRAVKRVSRITPVRQPWSRLRAMGPRAIEPTVREAKDA